MKKHILIIDDDPYIGNALEETLVRSGYQVSRAYSGTEAILLLSQTTPDLILLDLMLPGLCGEDVLPSIRNIPVIVLSAKADPDSKVQLLLSGAVDYVTKPFHTQELLARIAVYLRAARGPSDGRLVLGDLWLDPASRTAFVQECAVHLTRTEYAILKLLLQNPAQVMAKSLLLEQSVPTPPTVPKAR